MIEFNSSAFYKLKPVDNVSTYGKMIKPMFVEGETILHTFKALKDAVVFTNRRIIAINIQGVAGNEVDYTSLPYSKIQAFSVETVEDANAASFNLDSELQLWFKGLGVVRFNFTPNCNIGEIAKFISEQIL